MRALPETPRLFDRRGYEGKTFSRNKWKRIPSELICVVCDIKKKKIQQKSRKKQNRNKTAKNNHVVKSYVNWFVLLRVRSLFIEMFLTISLNMWWQNIRSKEESNYKRYRVWIKNMRQVQKLAISKKFIFFVLHSWNLVKMISSKGKYFCQVYENRNKNLNFLPIPDHWKCLSWWTL